MFDSKKYYRENRDEILEGNKKWTKKNLKRRMVYMRGYRKKYPEKSGVYYRKGRKVALKILGGVCVICGSRDKLYIHEKKGRPHFRSFSVNRAVVENPKRWALLCNRHHNRLHNIMRKTGFSFEKILQYKQFYFRDLNKEEKKLVTVNFDKKPSFPMVDDLTQLGMQCERDLGCIEEASQALNNLF